MALLVSACGFTEPRKFITINESCDTDGSFLISSLIGQRLRQQSSAIILVCCHQSLKYYETCGRKLGYNLSMSISKKSFIAIEPLRDIIEATTLKSIQSDKWFDDVHEKIKDFQNNGVRHISVIIDDVSFFRTFGCSEAQLIKISIKLNDLTRQYDGLSVILKIGLTDLHQHLANNIQDLSDCSITVERMKSGDFWDVDGKLIIKKIKCDNGFYSTESERTLLYHIGDHNVKLIAPGEHGLKF
ncbi:hypothetical protein PVAND_000584 [Polypedilum vanderplanki]|uniref:Elongator complex protein 6 n=1 Tax=Polypedilum vanderplanki TaxID=319348 RepID=A0A9J6BKE4_POLVA|nr:hypothetical protein PVAND_000584 [Polypedilum vanderplanki]